MRGAPYPPNPPYGGAEIYFGGLLLMDRMTTIESNIFVKLLASNITWAILGESPDPPYHFTPLDPYRGGALWGGQGGHE